MTGQQLATHGGEGAVAKAGGAPQSVLAVFDNSTFKQQVAAALPRHIGVDSMMRIALTEVRMNADLQKCTVPSFMGALLKAAQSGLRPGMFGEGWIIPRWNGRLGSMEAQFQPGYMGLAQLAYRSGEVAEVHAVRGLRRRPLPLPARDRPEDRARARHGGRARDRTRSSPSTPWSS